MANKDEERKIVSQCYDSSGYDSLLDSEKPDFILERNGERFGVEVTEYFHAESSARMRKQKDYVKKVANNEWIHKNDTLDLESVDTWIVDEDGSEKYIGRAVRSLNPTWQEMIHSINRDILQKNALFSTYDSSLAHIDLLIFDQGDLRKGLETNELFAYLHERVIANDLVTPFHNVTLVLTEDGKIANTFLLKH